MIVAVALDLGTTTIKAGLLAQDGTLSAVTALPAPVIMGDGGRYESDAGAYAETADAVLSECLAQIEVRPGGAQPSGVGAGASHSLPPLGLCSQRSSFLLWDRASGKPVTPLISWQDDRGAESCIALHEQQDKIRELSGLPLTPYYLAPKLRVLLQGKSSLARKLAERRVAGGNAGYLFNLALDRR